MPYVIKSKTHNRYVNGSRSKAAFNSMDDNSLVPIDYARIYPTLSGAKSALACWLYIMDDRVSSDLVEIVEVEVTRSVSIKEVR